MYFGLMRFSMDILLPIRLIFVSTSTNTNPTAKSLLSRLWRQGNGMDVITHASCDHSTLAKFAENLDLLTKAIGKARLWNGLDHTQRA